MALLNGRWCNAWGSLAQNPGELSPLLTTMEQGLPVPTVFFFHPRPAHKLSEGGSSPGKVSKMCSGGTGPGSRSVGMGAGSSGADLQPE